MIEIDGTAGGGQLLRTALTCSALTQSPVELRGIRGNRPEPGLRPQHVAAIDVMGQICAATVSTASVGETRLRFDPGPIQPGAYDADVGTAGSVLLVCDTLLPLATAIEAPLTVRASGGTDVKWAPTTCFYRRVKLPLLRAHGLSAALDVDRHGFYPAGGGTVTLRLGPSDLDVFALTQRRSEAEAQIEAVATERLAEAEVAERHERAAIDALVERGVPIGRRSRAYVAADSPGSALLIALDTGTGRAGFDGVGERGVPAEEITSRAVEQLDRFLATTADVDGHLADQLLGFLAISGGEMLVPTVTDHIETQMEVLRAFGFPIEAEPVANAVRLAR